MLRNIIAANLRKLRDKQKMTQAQLAAVAGFQQAAIAHFEAARRTPNCDNLAKLAKALKSSPNDILGFRV